MPTGRADAPACGAEVTLDESAAPLVTEPGTRLPDADPRLCRRCLVYASSSFGTDGGAPGSVAMSADVADGAVPSQRGTRDTHSAAHAANGL